MPILVAGSAGLDTPVNPSMGGSIAPSMALNGPAQHCPPPESTSCSTSENDMRFQHIEAENPADFLTSNMWHTPIAANWQRLQGVGCG